MTHMDDLKLLVAERMNKRKIRKIKRKTQYKTKRKRETRNLVFN